ncbi:MAG: hypothetical protein GY756_08885, partial [bacterium]|nr:hypothetical protein [bacterium]
YINKYMISLAVKDGSINIGSSHIPLEGTYQSTEEIELQEKAASLNSINAVLYTPFLGNPDSESLSRLLDVFDLMNGSISSISGAEGFSEISISDIVNQISSSIASSVTLSYISGKSEIESLDVLECETEIISYLSSTGLENRLNDELLTKTVNELSANIEKMRLINSDRNSESFSDMELMLSKLWSNNKLGQIAYTISEFDDIQIQYLSLTADFFTQFKNNWPADGITAEYIKSYLSDKYTDGNEGAFETIMSLESFASSIDKDTFKTTE